jgi:hypothetical protein
MQAPSKLFFSALVLLAASACGPSPSTGTGGAASTTTTTTGTGMGGDTTGSTTTGAGGSGGDPSQIDPPPMGQGFQMETEDIKVPIGNEEQDCYFFKISDLATAGGLDPTKPVNLHRIQIAQRAGTHHMNIFRVKTVVNLGPAGGAVQKATNGTGECFKSPNWADWPMVANSQLGGTDVDWTYPDGVANKFQPDEWIMLQTHYVNASTQQTASTGHVRVNFWAIPDAQVTAELGTVFATKQSIRICQSNPTPTFEGSCAIKSSSPVHIIGANGHFHSRGTKFDMFTWDGQSVTTPPDSDKFYESKAWNDPPMLHSPQLDVQMQPNGGIWYSCDFQWTEPDPAVGCAGLDAYDKAKYMTPDANLDCCYTFGPIVEKNEHCNAFVYYYPKQDNVNCF